MKGFFDRAVYIPHLRQGYLSARILPRSLPSQGGRSCYIDNLDPFSSHSTLAPSQLHDSLRRTGSSPYPKRPHLPYPLPFPIYSFERHGRVSSLILKLEFLLSLRQGGRPL